VGQSGERTQLEAKPVKAVAGVVRVTVSVGGRGQKDQTRFSGWPASLASGEWLELRFRLVSAN
jgi:hypothetical protein